MAKRKGERLNPVKDPARWLGEYRSTQDLRYLVYILVDPEHPDHERAVEVAASMKFFDLHMRYSNQGGEYGHWWDTMAMVDVARLVERDGLTPWKAIQSVVADYEPRQEARDKMAARLKARWRREGDPLDTFRAADLEDHFFDDI